MVGATSLERAWARIRRRAEQFPDQWEGQDLVGEEPQRVLAARRSPRRALVTANFPAVSRWSPADRPAGLSVVAMSGNMSRGQAAVISQLAPDRSAPITFVGDGDPMGLHAYVTLRVHLGVGSPDPALGSARPPTSRSRGAAARDERRRASPGPPGGKCSAR